MEEILHIINEMSPYLLLGFLLAGMMHVFIPGQYYTRYLAAPTFRSVINAALFGIPLPLCSCGVIPTAMSLRKEGASKGAVASFLIATPQTGVDSIIATFSLMGWPFAIVRPVAALLTAVMGGAVVNGVEKTHPNPLVEGGGKITNEHTDHCGCGCGSEHGGHHHSKIVQVLEYAFVEMMEDIGKWLVVGLFVAGLITVFVPDSVFAVFHGNTWASMLLVLCIAIPMYLCATGSIPIAVALMLKGLTPGAALVLLMAGPACNMASILVINKVMGRKTLVLYLASIITMAIFWGHVVDYVLPMEWFRAGVLEVACCHEAGTPWFNMLCTIVLAALLFYAMVISKGHHHHHDHCHEQDCSTDNSLEMKTYIIEGMHCNHCRTAAEKAIRSVSGVTSVSVSLETKEALVEGTPDPDSICKAIEEIGFTCKLIIDN